MNTTDRITDRITYTSEGRTVEVERPNAFEIAQMVECASPDTPSSPGAIFLVAAWRDAIEQITRALGAGQEMDEIDLFGVAEDVPSVYTVRLFYEFVDLLAWEFEEEANDLTSASATIEDRARICLFVIAEAVAEAARQAVAEALDDADDAE